MVCNKLFMGSFKRLFLEDLPNRITEKSLQQLFIRLHNLLNPYLKSSGITKEPSWNLLVSVIIPDFSSQNNQASGFCLITGNSWGEFYCRYHSYNADDNESVKSFKMSEIIFQNSLNHDEHNHLEIYEFGTSDGDDLMKRAELFLKEMKQKIPQKRITRIPDRTTSGNGDGSGIFLDKL